VETIQLSGRHTSTVRIATPYPDTFSRGRVIVAFAIDEVIDADLDHFGKQNILLYLRLRPATERPERRNYHSKIEPGDLEFAFESSVGLDGFLVARGASVTWTKDRLARKAGPMQPPPTEGLLGQ